MKKHMTPEMLLGAIAGNISLVDFIDEETGERFYEAMVPIDQVVDFLWGKDAGEGIFERVQVIGQEEWKPSMGGEK